MENEKFLTCPFCKADLTQEGLTYVQTLCTNYTNYIININGKWEISDSLEGENPDETYYTCRNCGKQLPEEYQDYFSDKLSDNL